MINPIRNNIDLLIGDIHREKEVETSKNLSFVDLLKEAINKTNQLQLEADKLTQDFVLGKIDDIHQVTIATEKAQLALNLTISIQNKVIETYQEIMRMQI